MDTVKLPDHPDAEAEYRHLLSTCDDIEREIAEVEAITGAKAGEVMDVQMKEDPDQQEEVTMQLFQRHFSAVGLNGFITAAAKVDHNKAANVGFVLKYQNFLHDIYPSIIRSRSSTL